MNCGRCGAQNEDNNTFCCECGMILRKEQSNPVPHKVKDFDEDLNSDIDLDLDDFSQNRMAGNLVESESVYQPLDTNYYMAPSGSSNVIYHESSKKKVFCIIGIILAVLLALGVGAYFLFPKIASVTMSPQNYYALAEKSEIEQTYQSLQDILKKYYNSSYTATGEFKFESKGTMQLPAYFQDLVDNTKFNAIFVCDSKNKKFKNSFDILYLNEKIGSMLTQEIDGRVGISYPGLSEGENVTSSYRWLIELLLSDDGARKEMTGMSKQDFNKLSEDIVKNVLLDSIQKENVVKGKSEYAGAEYRSVTFVIDEKVQKRIMLALAKELETNVEFKNLIKTLTKYVRTKLTETNPSIIDEIEVPTEEEIDQQIKSYIENLKKQAQTISGGEKAKYTVYYGNGNSIVAREISDSQNGTKVSLGKYTENNQNITQFILNDGIEEVAIKNTYEEKGKMIEGKASIEINGGIKNLPSFNINYNFEKDEKVAGVPTFVGQLKFEIQNASALVGRVGDSPASITFTASREGDNKLKIDVMADTGAGNEAIGIGITGTMEVSPKVKSDDIVVGTESTLDESDKETVKNKLAEKLISAMGMSDQIIM